MSGNLGVTRLINPLPGSGNIIATWWYGAPHRQRTLSCHR